MKRTITVTDDSIACAERNNRGHCAIAHSIAFLYPSARFIKVDRDMIKWTDVDTRTRYVYRTPRPAQQFIDRFDSGFEVDPFKVSLQDDRDLVDVRPMKARPPKSVGQPAKARKKSGSGKKLNHRPSVGAKDAA